ncbi:MAG: hypothetical protein RQ723_09875 [Desulfuromonadales bacterium]|nr:hypothetical protein [Desulfuromonadales bacterium]
MIHVIAYYLDAKDGRPANSSPLRHGPATPHPQIEIDAVDRRQRPAVILGKLPAGATIPAGATQIAESEYREQLEDYRSWRAKRDAETVARTKADMHRQVDALRDEKLSRYQHNFGGEHGKLSLQLRDSDDRTNWLTLDSACTKLIAAGSGDAPVEIRTEENVTVSITAAEAYAVIASMAGYGQQVMKASWQIKDAISQSAAPTEIDIEQGWPE